MSRSPPSCVLACAIVLAAVVAGRAGTAFAAHLRDDPHAPPSSASARGSSASPALISASATATAARRRGSGFDCSGFTRFVYAHFGIALPHYSVAQFDLGRRVSRWHLRPGDLVFFDGLGHVGLYIGRGRFIHAPHTGTRVSIASLSGSYAAVYDGAVRLVA